jgi:hypothetical protein
VLAGINSLDNLVLLMLLNNWDDLGDDDIMDTALRCILQRFEEAIQTACQFSRMSKLPELRCRLTATNWELWRRKRLHANWKPWSWADYTRKMWVWNRWVSVQKKEIYMGGLTTGRSYAGLDTQITSYPNPLFQFQENKCERPISFKHWKLAYTTLFHTTCP